MFTGLIHCTIMLLWQINPLISAVLRDIAGFLSAQFSSRKEEPGNCATWVCCRFEFDLNYLLISQSWLPRHWTISMASHEGVSCFQLRPTDTDRCTVGQISKNSSWWDVGMPISFQIQWITTWKKVLLYSRYKVFWLQKTSSKDFVLKKSCFTSIFFYIFSFRAVMTASSVKTIISPRVRDQSEKDLVQWDRSMHTHVLRIRAHLQPVYSD